MEDDDSPESEWEIHEYSNPKTSMVKCMLSNGYVIGKNMVITGIAISSAPIVVPPLVVFSAMGYAFSVPFGFVFATYSCTNKIMNTLLPIPRSPVMFEYYEQEKHQWDDNCRFELDEDLVTSVDGEKNEEMEDLNQGVDDYRKHGEAPIMAVVGNVDEGSSHANEDIDEEMENDVVQREINAAIEEEEEDEMRDVKQEVEIIFEVGDGSGQHGEAPIMAADENSDEGSSHANENVDEKETEDHEINAAIEEEEKAQMEENVGLTVSDEDQVYEENVGEYLEKEDVIFEDQSKRKKPLIESQTYEDSSNTQREVTGDEMQETVAVAGAGNGSSENNYTRDDEGKPVMVKELDSRELITDRSTDNETVVGEMRHIVVLAEGNEGNNYNAREVEELDLVAREVVTGDANKKGRKAESDEEVMRESMGTRKEKTGGYTANGGSEDASAGLRRKDQHPVQAGETGDESSLDSIHERNTNIHFGSHEANDVEKENNADKNVNVVAPLAFKQRLLATESGKAISKTKTNTKMPSKEDILDEERIWEKIGAMRTIVGYKAPRQPVCIRELKALYVFTGVEPPASFKDDSGLDEVNANLKFLMSIVGVK